MISKPLTRSALLAAFILTTLNAPMARADEKEDTKLALERLEKTIKELKLAVDASTRQTQDELANLRNRIGYLEQDIKFLKARIEAPVSTSRREPTPPALPQTSRVHLVNDYLTDMWIKVNDASYRLMPKEELTISVPAGPYTYQIMQLQRYPQDRVINPGEIKTIRVIMQP